MGQLTEEQESAAAALLPHDCGVLAAATAFGKTVVASRVLAARGRNTLILVHRRQLMDQWVARLSAFLDIDPKRIGTIGGGKKKPTGFIDVALIQSLVRKGEVSDVVANYGHLIVDECHHLPAVSFEAVARQSKAKFVLGLSATVTRKDGHHPIVFMQCGPVRYRVDARKQATVRPFAHKVVFRSTAFAAAQPATAGPMRIQELYGLMAKDTARNDLIFDDVLLALEAGRSPVILTERKDHLLYFADRLSKFAKNVIVFHGGMKAKAQKESERALKEVPDSEERVLLATGRYLGEGFDDARLDTLFLSEYDNTRFRAFRDLSGSIALQRNFSTGSLTVLTRNDVQCGNQNKGFARVGNDRVGVTVPPLTVEPYRAPTAGVHTETRA